ncbi:beta-galactosidase [Microbacterium sp.]|uniref:beta-galactosidase n=1 Tax=Microbacterium sp. TaxID=51671 RepID=UPI003F72E5D9
MDLSVTPRTGDAAPLAAPMPAPADSARALTVTDRAILRAGVPWVPVSGELHYSRIPRARWGERVRQLRAGGITVASTYVFWLHHVARRGEPRFDGSLDVGAFVDECASAGLDVALRIGPWAHGEARNGGFPDWVQQAPVAHRTDDPGYLALVAEWFGQLAAALDGRARPGGPIVAIQLENELYDRPEHLVTLKRLAREAGIAAPLWTATAWGGAQLPREEVFPLYGGYGDGFWTEPDAPWDDTFRQHYFFTHEWDDPGVGADVRATQGFGETVRDAASPLFPPATCELAGGMATAYHRRPWPVGADVAAVAHTKIGNGSMWQGYYMYAGGTNPGPDLEETHATGYPNDMVRLSYDFHAPIGQAGDLRESSSLLRGQHAFLDACGASLAGLPSSLPDVLPDGVHDRETLRWVVRTDGASGFLFVTTHQPHEPLPPSAPTRFRIGDDLVLPEHPVVLPPGTLARWPFGLRIGDSRVRWATASVLTVLPGPTLVLVAEAGVPVELAIDDEPARVVEPSFEPLSVAGGSVLVLPSAEAPQLWVRSTDSERTLHRTAAELSWDDDSVRIRSRDAEPVVERYEPSTGSWVALAVAPRGVPARISDAAIAPLAAAQHPPDDYGFAGQRHSAPDSDAIDAHAAVFGIALPGWARDPRHDAVVEIDWAGDVGELRVDGRRVDDRFWDGSRWTASVQDLGLLSGDLTLHLLPLAAGSTVWVPEAGAARRAASIGPLLSLDSVRVVSRGPWRAVD